MNVSGAPEINFPTGANITNVSVLMNIDKNVYGPVGSLYTYGWKLGAAFVRRADLPPVSNDETFSLPGFGAGGLFLATGGNAPSALPTTFSGASAPGVPIASGKWIWMLCLQFLSSGPFTIPTSQLFGTVSAGTATIVGITL